MAFLNLLEAFKSSSEPASKNGRPGGTRTPNRRIWNPLLYQLRYWPNLEDCLLPLFHMGGVFAANGAKLAQLKLGSTSLCFLRSSVVPGPAVRTLERNILSGSGLFGHDLTFLNLQATMLVTTPAPTVRPPSRMAKLTPSSMATGCNSSTVISMLSPGITISTPSGSPIEPVTSVVRT